MKDIKTSEGGKTAPGDGDITGSLIAGLVVRNTGTEARRVAILTSDETPLVGNAIHAADYAFVDDKIETVTELPVGFNAGYQVILAPARNYQLALTLDMGQTGHALINSEIPELKNFLEMSDSVHTGVPVVGENNFAQVLPSGLLREKSSPISTNLSFTLEYLGSHYHIGLNRVKHSARITADLNYQLGLIHSKLKGYVEISDIDLKLYLFVDEDIGQIKIPRTEIPYLEFTETDILDPVHLNNELENSIVISPTTVTEVTESSPLTTLAPGIAPSLETIFGEAISRQTPMLGGDLINDGGNAYTWNPTIPKEHFKPYLHDSRFRIALLKLNNEEFDLGSWKIGSVKYNISGIETNADLMYAINEGGNTLALIAKNASIAEGHLTSGVSGLEIDFPYTKVTGITSTIVDKFNLDPLEEYYLAIVAPATDGLESSPYFRQVPTQDVELSIAVEVVTYTNHEILSGYILLDTSWDEELDTNAVGYFTDPIIVTDAEGTFNAEDIVGIELGDMLLNFMEPCDSFSVSPEGDKLSFSCSTWHLERLFLRYGYQTHLPMKAIIYSMKEDIPTGRIGYTYGVNVGINVEYPETNLTLNINDGLTYAYSHPDHVENDPWTITGALQGDPNDTPFKYPTSVSWEFEFDGNIITPTVTTGLPGVGNMQNGWAVGIDSEMLEVLAAGTYNFVARCTLVYPWSATPVVHEISVDLEVIEYVPLAEIDNTYSELVIALPRNVTGFEIVDLDTDEVLVETTDVTAFVNDYEVQGGINVGLYQRNLIPEEEV